MADYSIVELVSNLPTDKFEELSRETGELRLYSFGPFESFCSINEQSDFQLSQKTKITSLEGIQRPIISVENTEKVMRNGLTPLKKLTVVNHDIRTIVDVQYLTRLEDLNLNHNKIVSIAGVEFPASLRRLSLEDNLIASLQGVVFPASLKELRLSSNKITSLEGVIFPDTLEVLLLDHNQIANLRGAVFPPPPKLVKGPEGQKIWDTVRAVHSFGKPVQGNQEIASGAIVRDALRTGRTFDSEINMEVDRQLQTMHEAGLINKEEDYTRPALPKDVTKIIMRHALQIPSFARLVSLKTLDLSHNKLTSLEGIDFLVSLKALDLSHNKLTSLEGIDFLTSLVVLNLKDNKLTSLALKLPNLKELDTTDNPIDNGGWLSTLKVHEGGKRKKQRKQIKQTKKNNKKYRRKTKKNERRRQRVK